MYNIHVHFIASFCSFALLCKFKLYEKWFRVFCGYTWNHSTGLYCCSCRDNKKTKYDIIKENSSIAGRYNIIFSAAFLLILILYLTNTLRHIFFVFFHDTSRFNEFVYVFLERMLRGELLAEIILCLTICFFGNSFRLQVKNQVQ